MRQGKGTLANSRICQAIEQLRGVEMAHVVMASGSEVMEVHVVATPERKPKQIVRDIESLLMAQFGLDVDYRKISLAQMREAPLSARTPRPQLVTVETVNRGQRRVQVILEENGQRYTGSAEISASASDSLSLTALATLNAMHRLVGRSSVFHLENAQKTVLGEMDVVLVLITTAHQGREENLVGTCFVRDDILEACARATLDSINRRIAVLVP